MTISSDAAQRLNVGMGSTGAGAEVSAILNGTTVQAFTGANTHSGAEVFTGGFTVTTAGITITDVNITLSSTTGTKLGATGDKLAVLGATPVVQRVGAAQAAVVTTGTTQSTPYGFATAAQGDALVTLCNELRAALVAFGIIKGAA